jgi:hypothetical protein
MSNTVQLSPSTVKAPLIMALSGAPNKLLMSIFKPWELVKVDFRCELYQLPYLKADAIQLFHAAHESGGHSPPAAKHHAWQCL